MVTMRRLRQGKRWLAAGLGAAVLWASPAWAQEEASEEETRQARAERNDAVTSEEFGVRIPKPEGWVIGRTPRGALAMFRATGEPSTQIEVRASKNVSAEQRDMFFTSFHNNLRKSGFTQLERRQESYAGRRGEELEYSVISNDQTYRLVVWQFHDNTTAWLVVGFFPESRRAQHYRTFQSLIRDMEFQS